MIKALITAAFTGGVIRAGLTVGRPRYRGLRHGRRVGELALAPPSLLTQFTNGTPQSST